jgi:iron-sulfur cluster repair protein YtfE (RIC family)
MTTVSTENPTQVLLPGQAAAPEGPCDMTGMYVMHHAFRRDLASFATAVARTPAVEVETWRALDRRWQHFVRELHHHHTKEDDALWPLLLSRVDEQEREVLESMEAEHDRLDPLLERVTSGLAALAGGAGTRAGLPDAVRELAAVLDAHLAHEETAAIPVIQAHVSAAEWQHLEETELRAKGSPRQLAFMLPWVADGLPDEVLATLLGGAPLPVRLLLRLGRRGYEKSNRTAFAHA